MYSIFGLERSEYSTGDLTKYLWLKTCCEELFSYLKDVNLFTLKIRMLDRIVDDVFKFEDLSYLDAASYEYFNITIEKFK